MQEVQIQEPAESLDEPTASCFVWGRLFNSCDMSASTSFDEFSSLEVFFFEILPRWHPCWHHKVNCPMETLPSSNSYSSAPILVSWGTTILSEGFLSCCFFAMSSVFLPHAISKLKNTNLSHVTLSFSKGRTLIG